MMFTPPFFGSPFYRRLPPPYYTSPKPNITPVENLTKHSQPQQDRLSSNPNTSTEKRDFSDNNSQVFNIMGITLYFDDILIVCLLFFLYSEGVQDEMLFISLILLLLS